MCFTFDHPSRAPLASAASVSKKSYARCTAAPSPNGSHVTHAAAAAGAAASYAATAPLGSDDGARQCTLLAAARVAGAEASGARPARGGRAAAVTQAPAPAAAASVEALQLAMAAWARSKPKTPAGGQVDKGVEREGGAM